MPLPDREVQYRFERISSGFDNEEDGKNTAFCIHMALTQLWDDATREWQSLDGYGFEIVGRFYIMKNDGTPNIPTIESLSKVLGWDGFNVEALHNHSGALQGQISVKMETYDGKTRPKAGWLSPYDYTPGFKPAPKWVATSLQSKWGSALKPQGQHQMPSMQRANTLQQPDPAQRRPAMASRQAPPPPIDDLSINEDNVPF